ncbi:uncharacterized protein EV420DRAFT_1572148, partial [Desarmillaria tabescens]
KGHSTDAEPTVVPDDVGADPEAPGPTETITVHPGGALNAQFFIPGLEHHIPAPASQPPTSHGTPPTPLPPVTPHNVQFSGGKTFNIRDLSEPSTPATPMPVLWPVAATPKSNRRCQHAKHTTAEMPNIPDLCPFYEVREDQVHCIFCCAQKKSTSFSCSTMSTSNWWHHLLTKHLGLWVEVCDRLKVKITADKAEGPVATYQESKGQDPKQNSSLPSGFDRVPGFSLEAFIDALVAFIVSNDQSFNVVESPELHQIFLMLCEELTDDDIPHRTQIWKYVQDALGKISFTCDMWSNANLVPFMAVTAHWIETKEVHPPNGTDLIGFHHVPGHHDGEHLA